MDPSSISDLEDLYRDLHTHPELGFHEVRTSGIVAETLRGLGYEVTEKVGTTGVVGILDRGTGPQVLLRADMDALPVREETGLPYASTVTTTDDDGAEVSVMHACGHDMHVTALLGAASKLAADHSWSGRLMLVFQPAEELGLGATAMVADHLFDRFGRPDIVLGQHVTPLPVGMIGVQNGPAFAAVDLLKVTLYGRGGHGSRPEVTIDPIVMAGYVITRLQTIVSREIAGGEPVVVTIGSIHAGNAANVIPDSAELQLSVRSFNEDVRVRVLASVTRIVKDEAAASGAEKEPSIEVLETTPVVVNDDAACAKLRKVFAESDTLAGITVTTPGPVNGSEDVGVFAIESGAPCAYWIFGGWDSAAFSDVRTPAEFAQKMAEIPSNHSPHFAPVVEPTLTIGINALTAAALAWLAPGIATN